MKHLESLLLGRKTGEWPHYYESRFPIAVWLIVGFLLAPWSCLLPQAYRVKETRRELEKGCMLITLLGCFILSLSLSSSYLFAFDVSEGIGILSIDLNRYGVRQAIQGITYKR